MILVRPSPFVSPSKLRPTPTPATTHNSTHSPFLLNNHQAPYRICLPLAPPTK
ncbi:hypothetical protein SODALDRAFT_335484 [Sodiomyces alkalinus F11]|uniref:Uncharacterized protein n=1 Tax=Sodiomyces alkalinus (strain CBS 110278 / VKM F-3762 / F11) TaxID=1314773 RepID=A0A3N2PPF3_SODAK|nr:hypothetical protein SODALDRAFT_335484 [Sodiomyces alkalinus F11]ROT36383.1 hypothetical protein SODALDRAFT_335484 [Sodiomyces alkalinus F11]